MKLKEIVKKTGDTLQKNSPHILTAFGAVGVVSTAILTGKATIKAYNICKEQDLDSPEEIVKICWKYYVPPVLMGGASIACIIGANSVNARRNAALAGLYTFTENTLKEYQEKVKEQVGVKKSQKIHDDMITDRVNLKDFKEEEVIITNKGNTLCYDVYTGRFFRSDIETIRRVENDLNHDLMGEMWVSLNDLYYALGLEMVKAGNDIGWTVDELIAIEFTSMIAKNDEPCVVIDYNCQPRYLWDRRL